MTLLRRTVNLVDRLVRPPLGPKTEGERMEIRFPDRHQKQARGGLHDLILDRWYSQRPLAAVTFGNHHPPHRTRPIRFGFELPAATGPAVLRGRL
jgi:hypothetical protein